MGIRFAFVLLGVAGLLLIGCGGSDTPASEPADGQKPAAEETAAADGGDQESTDSSSMFVAKDEPSPDHVAVCKRTMQNAKVPYINEQARADLLAICEDFGSADPDVYARAAERLCLRQVQGIPDPEIRADQEPRCAGATSPFVP